MPFLEVHPDTLRGDGHLGDPVPAADVAELRLDRWPPEVVLRDGRVGFVPAARRRDLELFGRLHGVPVVERTDVWALLAEPFLDTELDEPARAALDRRLAEAGVPPDEAAAIRGFLRVAMLARTAMTWEWVHYGLWDVLEARPTRVLPLSWSADARWLPADRSTGALRRWAEGIANRAPARSVRPRLPEPADAEVLAALRRRFLTPRWRSGEPPGAWSERLGPVEALRDRLLAAWCEPHRHHHGPRHLLAVLDAAPESDRAHVLAGWFHDAVYAPLASDNEALSARWLEDEAPVLIEVGAAEAEEVRVAAALVRATARPLDPIPVGPDEGALRRFHDADFGVFASLPADYDRYVAGVRAEYGAVPEEAFRAGRAAFLDRLQAAVDARGRFFHEASPLAEWLARRNLARERAACGASG